MSQTKTQLVDGLNINPSAPADALAIDNNGNVGVGTTSPDRLLELNGDRNAWIRLESNRTGAGQHEFIGGIEFFGNDSSGVGAGNKGKILVQTSNPDGSGGQMLFFTGSSIANDVERMRIDSAGKTGINIDNPGSYNGSGNELVLGNTGGNAGMTIVSNSTNNGHIFFADGTASGAQNRGIIKYEHGNDAMAFNTAETERLRITSNGTIQLSNSPGIDFSQIQTNAAGMTSETLDSYEEGNWTPSISGATLSGGSTGTYTRIGRFVYAFFNCPVGSHDNNSTVVVIAGLPFTGHQNSGGIIINVRNGIDHTIQLTGTRNTNSWTEIKFLKTVNDGNATNLVLSDCNTSWHLAGSVVYHVQ